MRACAIKTHMDMSQEHTRAVLCGNLQEKGRTHFVWKFTGKRLDPDPGDSVLCEPAQSKRTWTFHKSHFLRYFFLPHTTPPTSIEHRALTVTVRTPSVWPHCLGKYRKKGWKRMRQFVKFVGRMGQWMGKIEKYGQR